MSQDKADEIIENMMEEVEVGSQVGSEEEKERAAFYEEAETGIPLEPNICISNLPPP